jgi:hypothetical protein
MILLLELLMYCCVLQGIFCFFCLRAALRFAKCLLLFRVFQRLVAARTDNRVKQRSEWV